MAFVDNTLSIKAKDIAKLKEGKYTFKQGYKIKGNAIKTSSGIKINTEYIPITTQKTSNGGARHLLICPHCNKRIASIYLVEGSFKCRECANLRYRSTVTYRKGMDYCDLKIKKILKKLKAEDKTEYYYRFKGEGALIPPRPRYMQYRVYDRLIIDLRIWQIKRLDAWLSWVKWMSKNSARD